MWDENDATPNSYVMSFAWARTAEGSAFWEAVHTGERTTVRDTIFPVQVDIKEDVEITFKNNKVVLVKLSQANYTFEVKKEETNKKLDSINARFNTK